MLRKVQVWARRRKYRKGQTVSQFIARDIRRDIQVLCVARIEEGVITGRVRTTNVLYLIKGLIDEPPFGPPTELVIDDMWHWTGQPWGGLPDGTSIAEHLDQ